MDLKMKTTEYEQHCYQMAPDNLLRSLLQYLALASLMSVNVLLLPAHPEKLTGLKAEHHSQKGVIFHLPLLNIGNVFRVRENWFIFKYFLVKWSEN